MGDEGNHDQTEAALGEPVAAPAGGPPPAEGTALARGDGPDASAG